MFREWLTRVSGGRGYSRPFSRLLVPCLFFLDKQILMWSFITPLVSFILVNERSSGFYMTQIITIKMSTFWFLTWDVNHNDPRKTFWTQFLRPLKNLWEWWMMGRRQFHGIFQRLESSFHPFSPVLQWPISSHFDITSIYLPRPPYKLYWNNWQLYVSNFISRSLLWYFIAPYIYLSLQYSLILSFLFLTSLSFFFSYSSNNVFLSFNFAIFQAYDSHANEQFAKILLYTYLHKRLMLKPVILRITDFVNR